MMHSLTIPNALLWTAIMLSSALCQSTAHPPAEDHQVCPPLKEIVLCRTGVGFFEHRADVEGNAVLQMQFDLEQMGEVLRSMIAEDLDGGRLTTPSDGAADDDRNGVRATFGPAGDVPSKRLVVQSVGEGVRTVRIGYQHAVPVWKMVYRLTLGGVQGARLHGWAIAENTTDRDWRRIRLKLVGGGLLAGSPLLLHRGVEDAAHAATDGENFEYRIAGPVTLAAHCSVMLPVLVENVEAERLAIYDPAVHATHPRRAVRIRNGTGLPLMEGPIAVFEEGIYTGEGRMGHVAAGDEGLVTYALATELEVDRHRRLHPRRPTAARIVHGTLHGSDLVREHVYTVTNSGTRPQTVLIAHPFNADWDLTAPPPAEPTQNGYRFRIAVEPGATRGLAVEESRVLQEEMDALTDRRGRTFAMAGLRQERPRPRSRSGGR